MGPSFSSIALSQLPPPLAPSHPVSVSGTSLYTTLEAVVSSLRRDLLCHIGGYLFRLIRGKFLLLRPSSCLLVFHAFSISSLIFFLVSPLLSASLSALLDSSYLTNNKHLRTCFLFFSASRLPFIASSSAKRFIFVMKLLASFASLIIWNSTANLGNAFLLIPLSSLFRMLLNSLLIYRSSSSILFGLVNRMAF